LEYHQSFVITEQLPKITDILFLDWRTYQMPDPAFDIDLELCTPGYETVAQLGLIQ